MVLFIISCAFELLSSVLSFQPEELPLIFLVGQLVTVTQDLFIWEWHNFILKDSFSEYRILD